MKRFAYSALSEAGDVVSGELDGPDAETVIAGLHARALLPIHATERRGEAASFRVASLLAWRRTEAPMPGRDLALFSQQLSRLLKAGLPLDRALEILATIAGKRAGAVIGRTLDRVRDGASLSEAMAAQRGGFPPLYVSMIRAGEAGGALHAVLARVADFLARSEAMRQRVLSASIYPAILLAAALGAIVMVLTIVLPQFEPMFREAGSNLPVSTRLLMAGAGLLDRFWWAIPISLLAAALLWRWTLGRPEIAAWRDRVLLAAPVFGGLITKFEIGRFCRMLALLLGGGVAVPRALALCGAAVGNSAIAAAIETSSLRLRHGEGLSAPLTRTGRFPSLSLQLIRIGEETGKLDEMLAEVADIYDHDVERLLDRLLSMLVPAITIGMGVVVALIVAAVMTAMIGINDLAI